MSQTLNFSFFNIFITCLYQVSIEYLVRLSPFGRMCRPYTSCLSHVKTTTAKFCEHPSCNYTLLTAVSTLKLQSKKVASKSAKMMHRYEIYIGPGTTNVSPSRTQFCKIFIRQKRLISNIGDKVIIGFPRLKQMR